MKLPKLPRKNKKKEADIDGRVINWFYRNHPISTIVEVKMLGGRVTENQRRLMKELCKRRKFKYKFPDGGLRTPLDGISVKNLDTALCWCDEKGNCECVINGLPDCNMKIKV